MSVNGDLGRVDSWVTTCKDEGCEQATRFIRYRSGDDSKQSKCIECPFLSCLAEISSSDKVLLKHAPKIHMLYACLCTGMTVEQASGLLEVSKSTITYWRKNKERIEEKLTKLEAFLPVEAKVERRYPPGIPEFGTIRTHHRQRRVNPAQAVLPLEGLEAAAA
jgi:hypothetical protein